VSLEPSGKRAPRMSTEDFQAALDQAEVLLGEADRGRDRIRTVRAGQAGLAAIVAVALTIAVGASRASIFAEIATAVVCAVIVILLAGWAEVALIRPVRKRVNRDERTMLEIISLLRELLTSVADDETWSAPRQRFARARISRFPIAARGMR
jgi:hypothetical protein